MINSDFIQKQAALFIASLGNTDELEFATLVEEILGRVLQRVPTPEEVGRGSKLIEDWMLNDGLSRNEAIQNYCLLAMNLNEFVYLD
jgi:hypothetical protein